MNWLAEEGLALESSKEAQLSFLWHTFLFTRSCLDSVTKDLETNRLQHFAEMAGVRKSLEQIKIYTEQKDILAQEIQDENEQLRKQLLHLLSLQEMVELRKAKELNDRLDLEIRALRNRVRSLDAEKNSLKKTVESQQEEIQRLKSALQRQQQSLTGEVQADQENCKECPGCLKARNALLCDQDEHENLQREICEALNCVDEERSKYHNMKDKFMEKLCRAKQKLDEETVWRDKRISNLERELSLCYHSMKKEKEVVKCITMENEKLLSERRKLLQQLSEEEDNKKNLKLTASLTKTRVEYLETENKNLGNKMLQMSNLIATLERRLQNMQCLHFTEELQKMSTQQHTFTPPLTTRLLHEAQDSLDRPYYSDTKQADLTTSLGCIASPTLSRTAEVGYLNLSSTQRASEKSKLQSAFRTSENETS